MGEKKSCPAIFNKKIYVQKRNNFLCCVKKKILDQATPSPDTPFQLKCLVPNRENISPTLKYFGVSHISFSLKLQGYTVYIYLKEIYLHLNYIFISPILISHTTGHEYSYLKCLLDFDTHILLSPSYQVPLSMVCIKGMTHTLPCGLISHQNMADFSLFAS